MHDPLAALPFAAARVVCVGASGSQGLQDLCALVEALPPRLDAIVLMVLHRPSRVPSRLAEILERLGSLPVSVAIQGEPMWPGAGYIGEPDLHLTLGPGRRAEMVVDPQNRLRNRTIDALFQSVADQAGASGLGVVLSGALSDGSRGLEAIRRAGGAAMVRTPCAGVAGDMPRNALSRAGRADLIDEPQALAADIARWCALKVETRKPAFTELD